MILFCSENMKAIQVIRKHNCSNELLKITNPVTYHKRKKDKFEKYISLKNEIESDDYYKNDIK